MISGSETLVEFQSLCQILEINPQVYKQKHPAKQPSGMYVNLQWTALLSLECTPNPKISKILFAQNFTTELLSSNPQSWKFFLIKLSANSP